MIRRRWLAGAAAAFAALALPAASMVVRAASASGAEAREYGLAVVPQFPAAEIQRRWQPLLDRLAERTGIRLKLLHARSIPEFEQAFLRGTPDFAFLNPYHAVMARTGQGYVPLVRDGTPLSGILVVRRDDPVTTLRELDGRTLAFPAPNAFGASLYLRALLAEEAGVRIVPRYVGTHANTYRHVILGDATAGGGVNNTLANESEEVRQRLRVLYETPGVAPHPLAAHPRVSTGVRQAIADALLGLAASEDGRRLLAAVQMPQPRFADYARDYLPLERLRLERYVVPIDAAP